MRPLGGNPLSHFSNNLCPTLRSLGQELFLTTMSSTVGSIIVMAGVSLNCCNMKQYRGEILIVMPFYSEKFSTSE